MTIPNQPSNLVFDFTGPAFDTTSQGTIKDAFEASFVGPNGHSLVQTIGSGNDAFFNMTEGQTPVLASGVTLNNGTVTVSLAGLLPGTTGTLIFRLVNNDHDTTTSVRITSFELQPTNNTTPPLSSHSPLPQPLNSQIDLSPLSDITSSFSANYGQTTFDENNETLFAGLSIKNAGTYSADTPLIVVIKHLSDPLVFVTKADGVTPDGDPYTSTTAACSRTMSSSQVMSVLRTR